MAIQTSILDALVAMLEALSPPAAARPHIRYRHDPELGEDEEAPDQTMDRAFRIDLADGDNPFVLGDPTPGVRNIKQAATITMVLIVPGTPRGRWALTKEALEIRDSVSHALSRCDVPWMPTAPDSAGGQAWACEIVGWGRIEPGPGAFLLTWDVLLVYAPVWA